MLNERLFYFIHGLVTMYFLMGGLHRVLRKEASRLERICGYVLLYWFVLEVKDLAFYTVDEFRENYISNLLILIDITAVPVGSYFIIELLRPGWFTLRRALLLASPFLSTLTLYAITGAGWIVDATFILALCYAICFIGYFPHAIRRYNRMLNDNYSNTERIHIRWLKWALVLLLLCLAVWISSCYFTSWITDSIYQMTLMVQWVIILYYADRQQAVEFAPAQELAPKHSSKNALSTTLQAKLEQAMLIDKLWLNPHLTLSDLAMQVGTNRTYLSNYLNDTLHTTFYDYINSFRMEAAMTELHNPQSTLTMVELAEQCGFNSLSTFRRVFMRATGCSFNEYRRQMEQKRAE